MVPEVPEKVGTWILWRLQFFGVFLAIVDWLVQHGVQRLFDYFKV